MLKSGRVTKGKFGRVTKGKLVSVTKGKLGSVTKGKLGSITKGEVWVGYKGEGADAGTRLCPHEPDAVAQNRDEAGALGQWAEGKRRQLSVRACTASQCLARASVFAL